ncbi:hypothetical protein DWU98_16320 [Dyella monticola]|uniref:Uncharacterized protein n=1 Tax=Dyella monticola TaxID=1927958 RepID=A0A370WU25_9GAMM|nr:hypothetical protein [Dyella monticola]RDS79634.1 hypothetical protein DWU98_16320 [Dyella monticola]
MTDFWDSDIAAMNLSDGEKNGLQVFRNYSAAFEAHQARELVNEMNALNSPIEELKKLLSLLVSESPLSLAVIACAYADDQLKEMFKREMPEGIPGGRNELLNGFGPLSRLSQRIQVAYAFSWLSADLLTELDRLRRIRNDISHKWDMPQLQSRLAQLIEQGQDPIERHLGDGIRLPENFFESLQPTQKFRVRLIWLIGRIHYECLLFVPVVKRRLVPTKVLYSQEAPELLSRIAGACVEHTRSVIAEAQG